MALDALEVFFDSRPAPTIRLDVPVVEAITQAKSLIEDGDIDTELEQLLKQRATFISTVRRGDISIK